MTILTDVDAEPPAPQRSFVGSVNVVMLTYALDGVLAFITSAIIARALGAEGRGAYGLFAVSAAFGQVILGLGIGNAAIYYLNRREIALRDVLATMHVVVAASFVVMAAVVAAIAPWGGDPIFGEDVAPWLLAIAVPVILYMNLLRLTLQALSRFFDLGVATVGQQVILLGFVTAAYVWGDPTPSDVVGYLILASAVAAAYALIRIGLANVDWAQIVRPRMATLRRLATFGVQGEVGNVLQLMNYRLDQYIVRAFVGLAGVGIYAVAASMTEGVFILANAVALVLMPRLTSADHDEASRLAPIAARNTMLICGLGAIALAIVTPFVLPPVFGDDFEESVQALWWLLPGAVALTGSKVLTSYIFSRGRPLVNTMITCVSLVVTLVACFALIPPFGVNGAAAASSLAYGTHFIAALVAYRALSGRSALEAVLPRASDAELYADAARGLIARLPGRRPPLAQDRPQ